MQFIFYRSNEYYITAKLGNLVLNTPIPLSKSKKNPLEAVRLQGIGK